MADPNDKKSEKDELDELIDNLLIDEEEILGEPASYKDLTDDDISAVYTIVGAGAPSKDVDDFLQNRFLPPLKEWPDDFKFVKEDIQEQIKLTQEDIKSQLKANVPDQKSEKDKLDELIDNLLEVEKTTTPLKIKEEKIIPTFSD